MKIYFIFIVAILIVLPILYSSAAILESNGTGGGNWTDPNSWDGVNTPADMASGDTLVILAGDLITLTNNVTFDGYIQIYGSFHLNNGKLSMDDSSVIELETGSSVSAEHSGQNEQITIGSSKITSDDINDVVAPDILTEGTLPVEVIYFKVIKQESSVMLQWATSFEENFDYFTIERSFDGTIFNDYVIIYSRTEYSTQFMRYEFIDEMPFPGLSYYRLKSTDLDGSNEYHGIVSVNLDNLFYDFIIYPNPTIIDKITVTFNGIEESPYIIYNVNGKIIENRFISPGLNEISLSSISKHNIYLFQITGPQKIITKKFIIR